MNEMVELFASIWHGLATALFVIANIWALAIIAAIVLMIIEIHVQERKRGGRPWQ